MLPKRETKLRRECTEIEDFWGLYIVERQSTLKAALWSLFLLRRLFTSSLRGYSNGATPVTSRMLLFP